MGIMHPLSGKEEDEIIKRGGHSMHAELTGSQRTKATPE